MSTEKPLNEPADIPAELHRWNWGAFLLNWIWGIGNSTFIALLALIPVVNIVMMIVLGVRGSEWAWRNRIWRDAEHFRRTQRNWATAGVIVWIVVLGGCGATVGGIQAALKNSDAYQMTMDTIRGDDRVLAAIGDDLSAGFWVNGNINLRGNGSGSAQFGIPVSGNLGSGTVVSRAARMNGEWSLKLVMVQVDGGKVPIVIINNGEKIPGAEIDV